MKTSAVRFLVTATASAALALAAWRSRRRPQGRPQRVAVGPELLARRALRQGHAGRDRLQAGDQRPQGAADRAGRRLRSDHRRPQRAQAGRGRQGRRADGHLRRAGRDRHGAGRARDPSADDRPDADPAATGRRRLGGHGRAADAADDRRGGRAHEARRRQDRRLHRLLRRLGRPGLQRADEGAPARPASRCWATSAMRAPMRRSPARCSRWSRCGPTR